MKQTWNSKAAILRTQLEICETYNQQQYSPNYTALQIKLVSNFLWIDKDSHNEALHPHNP